MSGSFLPHVNWISTGGHLAAGANTKLLCCTPKTNATCQLPLTSRSQKDDFFSLLNMRLARHHLLRDQPFPLECPGAFAACHGLLLGSPASGFSVRCHRLSLFTLLPCLQCYGFMTCLYLGANLHICSSVRFFGSFWFFAYPHTCQNPFVHLHGKLCWNTIRIIMNL